MFLTDPETSVAFGEAEASMAIIDTNIAVVSASVATLGIRCVVSRVNIFLSEPLFMLYKFTDPNNAAAYELSTFAQIN